MMYLINLLIILVSLLFCLVFISIFISFIMIIQLNIGRWEIVCYVCEGMNLFLLKTLIFFFFHSLLTLVTLSFILHFILNYKVYQLFIVLYLILNFM